jgi:hypothetical protein
VGANGPRSDWATTMRERKGSSPAGFTVFTFARLCAIVSIQYLLNPAPVRPMSIAEKVVI